jgi:hypothetical protein
MRYVSAVADTVDNMAAISPAISRWLRMAMMDNAEAVVARVALERTFGKENERLAASDWLNSMSLRNAFSIV